MPILSTTFYKNYIVFVGGIIFVSVEIAETCENILQFQIRLSKMDKEKSLWRIFDMSQKILVVIDMQNDFITGSLGTPEAQSIVKKVKTKINQALKKKDTVVFTKDTHSQDYLDTQEGKKLPILHCIRYTNGWEIEKSLQLPGAPIFQKDTFGSLDLAHYLLSSDCQEVELVGVCTDICVISNALLVKAYLPELRIQVDAKCCAGTTPENHQKALDMMQQCQIEVV